MNTTNLNLVKPILDDNIHQTIQDLADNFQKIDDATELYVSATPTIGTWVKPQRVWNNNPSSGNPMGWVVTRSGTACLNWLSKNLYTFGDTVVPTIDNGHFYQCIQTGKSGVTVPTFSVSAGGIVDDTYGFTIWQGTQSYALNSIIKPTLNNDRMYVCTFAGVSGTTEPIWNTIEDSFTSDNGIQWNCYKIVKWEEKGTAVKFNIFATIS